MKVEINVVPPGGGETDYTMIVEMSVIPANGDYVLLRENGGHRSHIVRRAWWYLESDEHDGNKKLADVVLEVELAESGMDSAAHKEHLSIYRSRGKNVKELETSTY